MQCACATLSSVACPALKYFFHIFSQTARFLEKVIEYKMCVLIFYTTLPETFLIPSRIERDMIKIFTGLHITIVRY